MNVMRLHGKFGDTQGIVFVKNKLGVSVWVVNLDVNSPNDVTKATLDRRLI